ncbi:MAG: IS1182 family transposase [Arenicellales bacterium]|jgi:transposase|nr:IS1182 family transposase [Arenicellales bacterium]
MMGRSQQLQPKLFYTALNLDERVSADHPLRQIAKVIDFSFVREQVRELYGRRGNPSVDPAVLMKLMFLLHYENVASERKLMQQLPLRLDWLWFCGYDLDSQIPDHSVISKARRRWGMEVFQNFFAGVLGQCIEAGLVDGQVVHVDSSLIAASADRGRLGPALRLHAQNVYDALEQEVQSDQQLPPSASPPASEVAALQTESSPAQAPAAATADETSADPLPSSLVCPSDPDARLTRKHGQLVLGYKDHRVVDDRYGIVTATVTTDAAQADGAMLSPLLDQHQLNTRQTLQTVVADKGYGTGDNYQHLRQRGIRPCIPHERYPDLAGKLPRRIFHYDAQADGFICPAGQFLKRWNREEAKRRTRYRAAGRTCANCRLKSKCTDGKTGRIISRYDLQESIDWADSQGPLSWRRRLMRRRKIRAEGSFADAANNHSYKRARWRRLSKVKIKNVLIATIQNVRKLMRASPPRPYPGLLRQPFLAAYHLFLTLQEAVRRHEATWRPFSGGFC